MLAVISTTSAFAPRVPDRIDQVAKVLASHNGEVQGCGEKITAEEWKGVAHVINNAYGLQCDQTNKLINRACTIGRVDVMISSTDKNFDLLEFSELSRETRQLLDKHNPLTKT